MRRLGVLCRWRWAEAGTAEDPAVQAATSVTEKLLQGKQPLPWLYFNLVAKKSHVFVPVFDMVGLGGLLMLQCG